MFFKVHAWRHLCVAAAVTRHVIAASFYSGVKFAKLLASSVTRDDSNCSAR